MKEIIKSTVICTPEKIINGYMVIENGKIIDITTDKMTPTKDVGNNKIIPGIFDTHNHGAGGYNVYGLHLTDEERKHNIENYLKTLASLGVTSVFPTLFSTKANEQAILDLKNLTRFINQDIDGAKPLGIHFEGPFLNRVGENGKRYEPDPIDLEVLKEYLEITKGTLKVMGMAPELSNSKEAISLLKEKGVIASMAHSDCKSEEAFKAFENGISVATHVCNVMVGIHHRNVGGLGACLLDERVTCELICDGLHVCNDMLKLILKTKDHNKIMLISDGSRFGGLPSGKYRMDDGITTLEESGKIVDEAGCLHGSSKGVIYGIYNLVENVGIDLLDALKMASFVPAQKYGFTNKGSLEIGKDADFVIIDHDYQVLETYSEGRCIYNKENNNIVLNKELMSRRIHEK